MNVVDTNVISFIFNNNVEPQGIYYLPFDVIDEIELTKMKHEKNISNNFLGISTSEFFDESRYYYFYYQMLNKYNLNSFFNMTGFGDISTLATICTILDYFERVKSEQLFDPTEEIVIFTGDKGLSKAIDSEFASFNVSVKKPNLLC